MGFDKANSKLVHEEPKYQEIELGEVVNIISGYAFKSKDFVESGIPVIKIKNIKPPLVDIADVQFVGKELYEEKLKWALSYNDILISMTGSGVNQMSSAVGKVGRVKNKNTQLLLNQRVGKIVSKDIENIDEDYLYYWLSRDEIRYSLAANAGGSANQANINPDHIKKLKINLPPISRQRNVKNILISLDNKIELNNKIITTLEQLAQTLFKRWFVDFEFPNENGDPYKSSGGEMVESQLGMIPAGWRVSSLDQVATYTNGLAMQKFRPEKNNESLPVLKIKELREERTDSNSDRCTNNIKETVKINDGDIIFSWSATLLVKQWYGGKAGLNQHLFKVTSIDYPKWFYYYWTKFHLNQFIAHASDKATTMGHIKRSHLAEAKVLIPPNDVINEFSNFFSPIVDLLLEKGLEKQRLEELKDTLLPKLLSGEIELPEENEVTEDVPIS